MPEQRRFAAIDGLRGVAILWVTLGHLWTYGSHPSLPFAGLDLANWFSFCGRGVSLFFALSGFCLFYPMVKQERYAPDWRNFYMRRLLRIGPAYLLGLIVWFPIWYAKANGAQWGLQLVTHLTFTYMLFVVTSKGVNGILWSLGTEDHFYLSMPVLARLMYKHPLRTLIITALFSIGLNIYVFSPWFPSDNVNHVALWSRTFPARLFEFTVGMGVAYYHGRCRPISNITCYALWALGLFGLFGAAHLHAVIHPGRYWDEILYAPCWAALIMAALQSPKSVPAKIISSRPLVAIGTISYSLYLYNYMLIEVPKYVVPASAKGSPAWIIVGASAVALCGIAGYYIAETPFIKLRAKFRRVEPASVPDSTPLPDPIHSQQAIVK